MTTTVHMAVYDGLPGWEVGLATAHIANGWWQREPGRAEVRNRRRVAGTDHDDGWDACRCRTSRCRTWIPPTAPC